MGEMFQYVALLLLNLLLIVLAVRWRGLVSFEGFGLALLGVVLGSDALGLLLDYTLTGESTAVFRGVELRLYPTLVHFGGLLSLLVGLVLVDPHPRPVNYELRSEERSGLRTAGMVVVVTGLSMTLLSLYTLDIWGPLDYLATLGRNLQIQRPYGNFLFQGTYLALFGLAIVATTYPRRYLRQAAVLAAMLALAVFFTPDRSGIGSAVIYFSLVSLAFDREMLRSWARPVFLPALAALVLVTIGVKHQARVLIGGELTLDLSYEALVGIALHRLLDRFSSEGLYRGYSFLVERLVNDPSQHFDGSVARYIAVGWIPSVIYPDKSPHPFLDTGMLINPGFTSFEDEASAATLVGSAYADFGLPGAVAYLLLAGAFLAAIRRAATASRKQLGLVVSYVYFAIQGGSVIHNGLIGISDAVVFSIGLGVVIHLGMFARRMGLSLGGGTGRVEQGRVVGRA